MVFLTFADAGSPPDLIAANQHPRPAELRHPYIKADARAQTRLLEDHREGLSSQDRLIFPALPQVLLQALGDIQNVTQFIRGMIAYREEVTLIHRTISVPMPASV